MSHLNLITRRLGSAPARAEAALHQVLDDPVIASDPSHLGAVVLALENLEHDDVNAMARVGARLQAMPLSPRSRALLDELLGTHPSVRPLYPLVRERSGGKGEPDRPRRSPGRRGR